LKLFADSVKVEQNRLGMLNLRADTKGLQRARQLFGLLKALDDRLTHDRH